MKQDAFIQTLRDALVGLPKATIEEIVADYREYLGDALAAGRREEEVIAALGDPVRLARELKAQANFRQWENRRSFGNLAKVIVSLAGLGLLQLVLLVPFIVWLALLTAGYALSAGLTAAGLVILVVLGSHNLFGTPGFGPSLSFGASSGHRAEHAAAASGAEAHDVVKGFSDLKVDGDRFVIRIEDDGRADIVTRSGPIALRDSDDSLTIDTPNPAARALLSPLGDNTFGIRREDVVALSMRDGDDGRLSITRGADGKIVWDVDDDDGHVNFIEDGHGNVTHLVAKDGTDSVTLDASNLAVDAGNGDRFHLGAGGLSFGSLGARCGVLMLVAGIVGLLVCLWLTRITWRALTRHARRQIDALSTLGGTPQP